MTTNQLKYWTLEEDKRSHRAQETETNRANIMKERETERSNKAKELENKRSNLAKESETARANRAGESIKYQEYLWNKKIDPWKVGVPAASNVLGTVGKIVAAVM